MGSVCALRVRRSTELANSAVAGTHVVELKSRLVVIVHNFFFVLFRGFFVLFFFFLLYFSPIFFSFFVLRGGLVPVPGANYRCCAHVTFYFIFFFVFFPNWSVASIFVFLHSSFWQHAGEQKKKRFTLDWLFPFVSTASLIFPLCICFVLVPFRLLLEFINFFVKI